jgi:hypothetical protein
MNFNITYSDGHLETGTPSADDMYSNPYVVLYDGVDTLHFIVPDKGLYYEEGWIGYTGEKYVVDGDMMGYEIYRVGGGGGSEAQLIRKGSAGADIAEALNAYKAYIDGTLNPEDCWEGYSLIYLDDDDIPELVAHGSYEAVGNLICTYYDGNVYQNQLSRLLFSYIPKENLLCNTGGNMGYYYDIVSSLENGELKQLAIGNYQDNDGGELNFDEDGNLKLEYFWNDNPVSEEEYYKQLNAVFNTDKSVSVYDLDSDTDLGSLWMRVKPSE